MKLNEKTQDFLRSAISIILFSSIIWIPLLLFFGGKSIFQSIFNSEVIAQSRTAAVSFMLYMIATFSVMNDISSGKMSGISELTLSRFKTIAIFAQWNLVAYLIYFAYEKSISNSIGLFVIGYILLSLTEIIKGIYPFILLTRIFFFLCLFGAVPILGIRMWELI